MKTAKHGDTVMTYYLYDGAADEASAYYTNDLQDALGTARAMATRKRAYATD